MDTYKPNRDDALLLLNEYIDDESLINHSLMVEAAMRHFANIYDKENINKWGVIGLVHDLDFQKYPDQHCKITEKILKENKWPDDYVRGVLSHGYITCTDVEPIEVMEKIIYTVDELTGLIYATAIMRPSKSLDDLKLKSVKKKWKQKSFAAGVNRDVITKGSEMLDLDLNYLIEETIEALKPIQEQIGLKRII